MLGDGFFRDIFTFFQLLFSGYHFSNSEIMAGTLSIIIFGSMLALAIAFLITVVFVLPRKLTKLTEQLQELKIRLDLNNKDK